ncbi:MAG: YfhO family protein [Planctomycetes bacterium]|nr:YfhO family protein [Planctomycetota bacterium]
MGEADAGRAAVPVRTGRGWGLWILGAWIVFFGPMLATGRPPAFRDAGHYYFPLHAHVRELRRADLFPLWTDREDLGRPIAGDPTWSVFYPPAMVLALPLSFPRLWNAYIAGHALLAAFTCYSALRRSRRGKPASACAAIAYAFGGCLIAQHANVVYLVGAAWLPLALHDGAEAVRSPSLGRSFAAAIAMAMMVLGGDPQLAAHAAMALALLIALEPAGSHAATDRTRGWRGRLAKVSRWAIVVLLAAALAAPQMLLGARWSGAGSRADNTYAFHFAPWRWLEFVYPNVAGRTYPEHRRWTKAFVGEGPVWFASAYIGLLPIGLAAAAACGCRRDAKRRWPVAVAAVGLAAAAGDLGIGLAVNRALGTSFPSETGSAYWLLECVVPFYAKFRYPAKWMVMVQWALTWLVAAGWDDWRGSRPKPSRSPNPTSPLVLGLALSMSAAIVAIVILTGRYAAWSSIEFDALPDPTFGPLNGPGAWRDVAGSLTQHLIVGACILGLSSHRARVRLGAARWSAAMLVLTILDLAGAHRWQLEPVRSPVMIEESAVERAIRSDLAEHHGPNETGPVLVFRADVRPWRPEAWSRRSDPRRLDAIVAWDRASLYPKHHLAAADPPIAIVESSGFAIDAVLASFLRAARTVDPLPLDQPSAGALRALGVEYLLLPLEVTHVPGASRIEVPDGPDGVSLWRIDQSLPRVSLVHEGTVIRPLPARPSLSLDSHVRRHLVVDGRWRDLERWALIEADRDVGPIGPEAVGRRESCEWQEAEDGSLAVSVDLASAGWLVVRGLFDPGWRATISTDGHATREIPVFRANRVMRAVRLDAGRHRVEFHYAPKGLGWAFGVSLFAWGAAIAVIRAQRRRHTRPRPRFWPEALASARGVGQATRGRKRPEALARPLADENR